MMVQDKEEKTCLFTICLFTGGYLTFPYISDQLLITILSPKNTPALINTPGSLQNTAILTLLHCCCCCIVVLRPL